jgi:hypothetical protein
VSYPRVLDELDTIYAAIAGANIARCGDGEAKIACGKGYVRQNPNEALSEEMRTLMRSPNPGCLVCIPTLDPSGPKYENWLRHEQRLISLCNPEMLYGSAFISRPDSSPWINNQSYAQIVARLWRDKRAVVICEKSGSMVKAVRCHAAKVVHISCPRYQAYRVIDRMEQRILEINPDIAILAVGPTATCLANRLAGKVHTIDLGSAGGFLSRLLGA